jgi:hypothetical protein
MVAEFGNTSLTSGCLQHIHRYEVVDMTFGKFLRSSGLHLTVALLTTGFQAVAQDAIFSPPAAMVLDNVPAVPASVAAQVARYTEFKPTSFATPDQKDDSAHLSGSLCELVS